MPSNGTEGMLPGDPRINSYIDYSLNRDYGFDFNYKLYMYFRFFEDTNRIKLIRETEAFNDFRFNDFRLRD